MNKEVIVLDYETKEVFIYLIGEKESNTQELITRGFNIEKCSWMESRQIIINNETK